MPSQALYHQCHTLHERPACRVCGKQYPIPPIGSVGASPSQKGKGKGKGKSGNPKGGGKGSTPNPLQQELDKYKALLAANNVEIPPSTPAVAEDTGDVANLQKVVQALQDLKEPVPPQLANRLKTALEMQANKANNTTSIHQLDAKIKKAKKHLQDVADNYNKLLVWITKSHEAGQKAQENVVELEQQKEKALADQGYTKVDLADRQAPATLTVQQKEQWDLTLQAHAERAKQAEALRQ